MEAPASRASREGRVRSVERERADRYQSGPRIRHGDRFLADPRASGRLAGVCDSAQRDHLDEILAVCQVNARWDEANLKMDATIGEPILDAQFFWIDGYRWRPKSEIVDTSPRSLRSSVYTRNIRAF